MRIEELEDLARDLARIAENTKISARQLAEKGLPDDSRVVDWDAKQIEVIYGVVKEHIEFKTFLKSLIK